MFLFYLFFHIQFKIHKSIQLSEFCGISLKRLLYISNYYSFVFPHINIMLFRMHNLLVSKIAGATDVSEQKYLVSHRPSKVHPGTAAFSVY